MTLTQIKPAGLSKPVDLADNEKIRLGTGNDLEIFHDGSNSYISDGGTGDLIVRTNGGKIGFTTLGGTQIAEFLNNGGCSLRHQSNLRVTTTAYGVRVYGGGPNNPTTDAWDSNTSIITSGSYGGGIAMIDGSRGFVQYLHGAGVNYELKNAATDSTPETNLKAIANGAVELYYDNVKKFETLTNGVQVTGNTVIDGTGTQTTSVIVKNGTDTDGTRLGHSSNSDRGFIQVTENGADFGIQVGGANTSNMRLELFGDSTTASRICLGTEEMITAAPNGAVSLYYDNSKKLETTSIGITLFGDLKIPDNEELRLGDGNDLQIYHNGSNTYLDSNTGNLYFRGSGGQMLFRPNNAEDALILKPDGAVELYYNNSKKIETTNDGVDVTGNFKAIGGSTEVQIQPADGLINFGMDGRSSFVTGTNACYIFSGSGSSGDMPAGDLILQSRSNVNRTIRFVTGSSPAQRMSIDSGGLKFGTDTADANALNDYEEGTWTPTTANSGGGFTNIISATYTKIGRLVNVSVYAVFDSSQPNSNQVRIGGLPFASISTIYHYAVGRLQGFADKDISWQVGGTSDYFTPYYNNSIPTYNQVAGNYVIIAGSYITNS